MFFVLCVYYNFDIYTHTHLKECPRVLDPGCVPCCSRSKLGQQSFCKCGGPKNHRTKSAGWPNYLGTGCLVPTHDWGGCVNMYASAYQRRITPRWIEATLHKLFFLISCIIFNCAELCWGAKAALAGQTGKKRKARGQDVVSGAVRSSWKKNLKIVTSRKEKWSTQKITKVGGCFEEGSERWLWPGSCANQAADHGGGEIVAGRSYRYHPISNSDNPIKT